ncbi:MAG TPA: hypothetical protein VIM37_03820 [Candidatus Microsaccharimonas sp.]
MSPQHRSRPLSIKESGALAEITVSDKRYRDALNAPFASDSLFDVDVLHAHQATADMIIGNTLQEVGIDADPETQRWEAGRNAVLTLLSRKALGSFQDYFLGVDVIPTIPAANPELLPEGRFDAVATNNRIMRYSRSIDDPIEFFDTSLGVIDRQKKIGYDKIGPENFATAMKLFSDKYSSLKRENTDTDSDSLVLPDIEDVKHLTNEALRGFFDVASRDAPNYLEMTNIFASIRALPKGVVDSKFTQNILLYATKDMDQYEPRATRALLAALSKIDTSEYPLETSALVNMMLHSGGEFETTRDLRTTIRVIETLQMNPQTDAAIKAFFELAEGFDQPLELEGIDEVIDRLNHIVSDGTEDRDLSVRAKKFANKCMDRANRATRQLLASGTLTQAQMEQLKITYTRIKTNYESI